MTEERLMERKNASDFPPEVLDILHRYIHGEIGRRGFLDQAARFAVGGLTAAGMLEMLSPNYAWAQQVPRDDPRIRTDRATVGSPQGHGSISGYLARPAGVSGTLPAILVIHENRGLTPYIENVARRLATSGYMAFAPDGLTSVGGYPGDDDRGRQLFASLDQAKMREDFVAAAQWLKARPDGSGTLGAVGFCYGGGVANALAVRLPDLAAAVPFYGPAPALEEVARIRAAVQVHHGELDTRLVQGWPAYEAALKRHRVRYEGYVYPGAHHGFHNDTTPRYDDAAARLAWQRTLDFFGRHVRGG
jgi:carboxymethylenebutenolidase